ncbi:hypothetical protein Ancab_020079 [Ancistrocladus abbreviatus]
MLTTLGIVKHVNAKNVAILDQSPHPLAKAKAKEALKDCKMIEGDAEDLPFPTDYADRFVSAGRKKLAGRVVGWLVDGGKCNNWILVPTDGG